MKWTKQLPGKAGWYFWRQSKSAVLPTGWLAYCTVELAHGEIVIGQGHQSPAIEHMGGEWAGPIPEPEDAK